MSQMSIPCCDWVVLRYPTSARNITKILLTFSNLLFKSPNCFATFVSCSLPSMASYICVVYLILVFLILAYQDISGTLATEEAEDAAQVAKLRSALESVDHKRRKVLFV